MVGGGSFHLPHDLFHSTLLCRNTFHHLSQFVLKMEYFRYVQVDNHMQKYGQERFFGFFCSTSVESKYQSNLITKVVQMIFLAWSGYFEYVTHLSHGTMLTGLNNVNVSIWLLSTSTSLPNCGTHPANLQHEILQTTLDMFRQSQHFLHTLQRSFFVFQLHFYLSRNNKT